MAKYMVRLNISITKRYEVEADSDDVAIMLASDEADSEFSKYFCDIEVEDYRELEEED